MSETFENLQNNQDSENALAAVPKWTFENRELPVFVANGTAVVAVELLDLTTRQPTGAMLTHYFEWDKNDPFIIREQSFKTKMKSVGRQTKKQIDTPQINAANTKLYEEIIHGGLLVSKNEKDEEVQRKLDRQEMLQMIENYPELASEAIESWLEAWHFEVISDEKGSFDWLFQSSPIVKVLGRLGSRDMPLTALIITFSAPGKTKREKYEEERQKINSDQIGELKVVDVQESFPRKLQYGSEHLQSVEGVGIKDPNVVFDAKLKQDFITLFGPPLFAEAVDKMHESFDFTRGRAASS